MDTEQPNPQPPLPSSPPSPVSDPTIIQNTPVTPIESQQPEIAVTAPPVASQPTTTVNSQSPTTVQQPSVSNTVVQPSIEQPTGQSIVQSAPSSPSLTSLSQPDTPTVPQPVNKQVVGPHMSASAQSPARRKISLGGIFGDKRKIALIAAAVLFAFVSAIAVYFVLAHSDSKKKVADLEKQIATLTADTHDLPEGAIQVSECIPNMGFHYIDPDSDPRFGPYYLVNKQGKVIGSEYMFNNSMLTSIPAGIDLEVLLTDGPVALHGWQYESIDFARSPSGHPGFVEDHLDVHVYTVTPEEQKKSCE